MRFLSLSLVLLSCFARGACPESAPASSPHSNFRDPVTELLAASVAMEQARISSQIECVKLQPGQSVIINWDAEQGNSPTSVDHHYKLTRLGPSDYLSEVRLHFKPMAGQKVTSAELAGLSQKVNQCLLDNSKYLKRPDGTRLQIALTADPKVPAQEIQVSREPLRANAETYFLGIDCPTLMHEVMHIHGLVDEYQERVMGVVKNSKGDISYVTSGGQAVAFNCRNLGAPDSLMNNQYAAFNSMNPDFLGEIIDKTVTTQHVTAKLHDSILEPAQFNTLIHPGCADINKFYYACATNAYASTFDPTKKGCRPVALECRDPYRWVAGNISYKAPNSGK